jgi:hypothetical protein
VIRRSRPVVQCAVARVNASQVQKGRNVKPAYTADFVDRVFASRDYGGLVWLSGLVCGQPGFQLKDRSYGLPPLQFLFVESLLWFAQARRSGVWTYFEATPAGRQEHMRALLAAHGPDGFGERYAEGMATWREPDATDGLDRWIDANFSLNSDFLWGLAVQHRQWLDDLIG